MVRKISLDIVGKTPLVVLERIASDSTSNLIAKQEKLEFENKKIVKNNNFILNKDIYKEE